MHDYRVPLRVAKRDQELHAPERQTDIAPRQIVSPVAIQAVGIPPREVVASRSTEGNCHTVTIVVKVRLPCRATRKAQGAPEQCYITITSRFSNEASDPLASPMSSCISSGVRSVSLAAICNSSCAHGITPGCSRGARGRSLLMPPRVRSARTVCGPFHAAADRGATRTSQ